MTATMMTRWRLGFACALGATAAYCTFDNGSLAQSLYYLAVCLAGLVGFAVGVHRAQPVRVRMWRLLGTGLACTFVGEVVWSVYSLGLDREPFPSPADGPYLAAYVFFVAGLAVLLKGRVPGRDRAGLLDAGILATGCGVVTWILLIDPVVSGEQDLLGRVLSTAYPIGDLALLVMLARLVTSPGARLPAFWLVGAGIATTLVADTGYLMAANFGDGHTSPSMDTGWLLLYVCFGAAALHPSASRLSEPLPEHEQRHTTLQLALLVGSALLPPTTLLVQVSLGVRQHAVACAIGSILLLLLVAVRMAGLVNQLRRQAVQLAALASEDGLTGIANRRTWDHDLSRACASSGRTGEPLTVALLDLDHFKSYNDTHGHQAGDRLLVQAAALWQDRLVDGDLLARYGGEEFGVLLPGRAPAEARALLEELRLATPEGQTVSVGAVGWLEGTTPSALVAAADLALYEAKRRGRDRLHVGGGVLADPDGGGERSADPDAGRPRADAADPDAARPPADELATVRQGQIG